MNKCVILILLLAIANNGVTAEWVAVSYSPSEKFISKSDLSTIRRDGSKVKIWEMRDYENPIAISKDKFALSTKALIEYDCKDAQWRTINASLFSEHGGAGKLVATAKKSEDWLPVAPESVAEANMQFACGKK